MMKNFIILALLISSYTTLAFADHRITQGPDIGEIYFIGPTATGEGIYHSTDFGKTAICVDSTIDAMSICADRSSDVLYYVTMGEALYISYDSGLQGSWLFRNGGVKLQINSGRSEGEIYSSFSKHSEDYGVNFISHNAYGFFGSRLDSEIDNEDNIGYIVVNNYPIIDSLWLLITHDNFDSLEIQNVYNVDKFPIRYIRRGTVYGELFSIAGEPSSIRHSDDYGESWHVTNTLNSGGSYYDFVGGRQDGELYILSVHEYNLHEIVHIYIYHSTDYGKTFIVYHPFSKGEEPLVANFSSAVTEGNAPLAISFCNYSVGDIQSYEWDFDNDGVIDSYDAEPEYTYQDTGYYSVKLTIYDNDGSDEFLRENYIYVKDPNAIDEKEKDKLLLHNSPNPFKTHTTIRYNLPKNKHASVIEIYNLKGQLVDTIPVTSQSSSVEWNRNNLSSGIYFYKLNREHSPVNKMIIIK